MQATRSQSSHRLPVTLALLALGLAISFAASGQALTPGKEYMVVTNHPNNLHVIDLAAQRVMKTCELPGIYGPATLQISPDRRTAYAINNQWGHVYGIELDTCRLTFHATLSLAGNERAKSICSLALSPDGAELYVVASPTILHKDRYEVQPTRLQVYSTRAGLNAKPIRTLPAPRQVTVMQTGADGSLYMAGADIYKVNVRTGKAEVAIPSRNWERPLYAPPDVLNAWPMETPTRDFTILYTTAKFQDESFDMDTAEWIYGYMNVNLDTGATETVDFAELVEIYFTGMLSPKDRNIIYGVLNRLTKYDVREKKLLAHAELDHSYYAVNLSRDGSRVYLGGTLNDIAIFDADDLRPLGKIKLPGGDQGTTTPQIFIR
jgi:quinohemoprotein amine dehydrogenase beta subunit